MLIGGRPLPRFPWWVRLLIILALLSTAPFVGVAIKRLPASGIKRPAKLTAEETAAALPKHLPLRPVDESARDIRCVEQSQTGDASRPRAGAWDYVCTFVAQPKTSSARLKVGVRVGSEGITCVSLPYGLKARHIR